MNQYEPIPILKTERFLHTDSSTFRTPLRVPRFRVHLDLRRPMETYGDLWRPKMYAPIRPITALYGLLRPKKMRKGSPFAWLRPGRRSPAQILFPLAKRSLPPFQLRGQKRFSGPTLLLGDFGKFIQPPRQLTARYFLSGGRGQLRFARFLHQLL